MMAPFMGLLLDRDADEKDVAAPVSGLDGRLNSPICKSVPRPR